MKPVRIWTTLLLAAFYCASAIAVPVLPKGHPVGIGDSGDEVWVDTDYHWGDQHPPESVHILQDAATGAQTRLELPPGFAAWAAVRLDAGLAFLGLRPDKKRNDSIPQTVVLHTAQGRSLFVDLPVLRSDSRFVVLKDQSLLAVGGVVSPANARTGAVERVYLEKGSLRVERLPDVPSELGGSYALVALNDGRAMILGGSNDESVGCELCVADTYILEPKSKTWSKGPRMLEPRSNAAATLLSDGSVLVVGGWTPEHGWNSQVGASRSTERWLPGENRFVADAPLPYGVARAKLRWAARQQGRQLLLTGGMRMAWVGNDGILDFDATTDAWREVGRNPPGTASPQTGALVAGSLVSDGQVMLWTIQAEGQKSNPYTALDLRAGDSLLPSKSPKLAAAAGALSPKVYHSNISRDFLLAETTSPGRTTNALWWVKQGADVDTRNDEGSTLLMLANKYWDIQSIQYLIDTGADINASNKNGEAELMQAIQDRRADVVRLLLSKGVDFRPKDRNGKTALLLASETGLPDAVSLLLEKGQDINARAADGSTALMLAARNGQADVVQILLTKGADANASMANGQTALMLAVVAGQTDAVRALLSGRIDINARDSQGTPAVDMAPKENPEIRALLIKAGAVTAAKNPDIQGVWKGQLNNQEITACFELDGRNFYNRGAYYYAKYRKPILLKFEAEVPQAESTLEIQEAQGKWHLDLSDNDTLSGTWSAQGRQYPLHLVRVPLADRNAVDQACRAAEFNDGRKPQPQFVFTTAAVDGSAYRIVADRHTKGVKSFELSGSGTAVENINRQLRDKLVVDIGESFECTDIVVGLAGGDGEYLSDTHPIFISRHWLAATISTEADCGGAHPNSDTSYRLWNLDTGKEIHIWTWFNKNGARQDSSYFAAGPALTKMLQVRLPKSGDGDCDAADIAESWQVHPDATGLIFSPELPHVIQACAEDIHINYGKLMPMLNARGKAAVASIAADLAKLPAAGK